MPKSVALLYVPVTLHHTFLQGQRVSQLAYRGAQRSSASSGFTRAGSRTISTSSTRRWTEMKATSSPDWLPRAKGEAGFEQLTGLPQDVEFFGRQIAKLRSNQVDSSRARTFQEPTSRCGRLHLHCAPIGSMRSSADKAVGLEAVHDPGHRRRAHTFCRREFTQRERPAEHRDREGRQSSGADLRAAVLLTRSPKQVNRGRVEDVCNLMDLTWQSI